ncbi:unnamed protein product [Rhizoctonia solani]|uniref:BZIP domain-containing protein n=1 Tax=Rhizoctonia solani TaxID=456999 RepID=A0A8H2XH76_9AGAM|nr:unnamed protein product [Rhizoctonia solani]
MSTGGKRSPPRNTNMMSQSHDSDEEMVTPPGSVKEIRSLSRNAQAQARLRARRKAYVESLEANVKRLQTIVDAIALNPNRAHVSAKAGTSSPHLPSPFDASPEASSPDASIGLQQAPDDLIHQLQTDNSRLRRERDALQVQIDALIGYISRGYNISPNSTSGGEETRKTALSFEHGLSPSPGSDAEIESHVPITASPLIRQDAYTQDEFDQLLSFNDPNLAFMRYLNLQPAGSSGLQVSHPNTSGQSSPATFDSLSAPSAEPTTNFIQGTHEMRSDLMFRGAEP